MSQATDIAVTCPEMIQLLQRRRSVSPVGLVGPGPTAAEIDVLMSIATRVPDHGKLTPWRFIVFAGDARARAGLIIADVYKSDNPSADIERLAQEERRLALAPLVIGVVSQAAPHLKIPAWEQTLSTAAATTLLVIAANALGYATAWLTEWYAYDRRVLARLGLASAERMAGFVHIGRAKQPPLDRPRPPLAEKVLYF